MADLEDALEANMKHRTEQLDATKATEQLARDHHVEMNLANLLASKGHHANTCMQKFDLSGHVDITDCTCGWSGATNAWWKRRTRMDGEHT
mgnify:CR=1 FL=1